MYSLTTPKPGPTGGPTTTTIRLADNPAVASSEIHFPAPVRTFDPNFNLDTETYGKEVTFWLSVRVQPDAKPGPLELTAQMRYQLCTDKECLPPKKVTATASLEIAPGAPSITTIPSGLTLFQPPSEGPRPPHPRGKPPPPPPRGPARAPPRVGGGGRGGGAGDIAHRGSLRDRRVSLSFSGGT
jgi:thiol:disulfide interchange protein DsbD